MPPKIPGQADASSFFGSKEVAKKLAELPLMSDEAFIEFLIRPLYLQFLKKTAALMVFSHQLFISYAWPKLPQEADIQLFLAFLYDDFKEHFPKLKVIFDLKSLKPGMNIDDFMEQGIQKSRRALMVGSTTYGARSQDARTNVHKEASHIDYKREVEEKYVVPLLYCGDWASAFPEGYQTVLAVADPCQKILNFYRNISKVLFQLLALLPSKLVLYESYEKEFLGQIEQALLNVDDEQIAQFKQAKSGYESQTQQIKRDMNEAAASIQQHYPSYQQDEPEHVSSQGDVEKLLLHVARGEQDEAEAMLKIKGNEFLLLHKGKVTDYSNRTFNSITAFQYALWALDWHMWKMLRTYLDVADPSAAARQLQDLESNGPGLGNADHGKHYDFTPLMQALKTYVDQFDALYAAQKYGDLQSLWIKGVGGAQCLVPAHVANEYCRPDRPFHPRPTFTEDTLPRTFDLYSDNKFFPLSKYSWGSLSLDFFIHRDSRSCGTRSSPFTRGDGPWTTWTEHQDCLARDLIAITGLCEVRTWQYQDLKRELSAQLAARPRP